MARRYCEDKSAIILCVVAANADMTTSDALLLAKKLDPNGIIHYHKQVLELQEYLLKQILWIKELMLSKC